jgi:glycosyltransferase involved in cell wall biosynthesis
MARVPMKRVCLVTTSPLIVNFFLVPHLLHLRRHYDVVLAVTLPGEVALHPLPGIDVIPVEISRRIRPLSDVVALESLRRLFRERQFQLVHSFGPKAGLLASTAGGAARVRARIHTFTGQIWATRSGPMRALLRTADRWIARMATHILADSPSQRDFLVREGILRPERCIVLGDGSLSGVDTERFRPDPAARAAVRAQLTIGEHARVVAYLGRLIRDKGVLDLARAFPSLPSDTFLLVVGPDEDGLAARMRELAGSAASRMRFAGYTTQPERFLAASDVLCLPSYREGFGTVIIEAAAACVPAVASRIYGVTDALLDGETGLLFRPGDAVELARVLSGILVDDALRGRLGASARRRAMEHFAQTRMTHELAALYARILGAGS